MDYIELFKWFAAEAWKLPSELEHFSLSFSRVSREIPGSIWADTVKLRLAMLQKEPSPSALQLHEISILSALNLLLSAMLPTDENEESVGSASQQLFQQITSCPVIGRDSVHLLVQYLATQLSHLT